MSKFSVERVITNVIANVIMYCIIAACLYFIWNDLLAESFQWPHLSFWQMVGVVIGIELLKL